MCFSGLALIIFIIIVGALLMHFIEELEKF